MIEIFTYSFSFFLLKKKGELIIIYLPVVFFTRSLIKPIIGGLGWYPLIMIIFIILIYKNINFFKKNIYSILLIIYFSLLFVISPNKEIAKGKYFSSICIFLSIPLIQSIYYKFSKKKIQIELFQSATIILFLFITNIFISTLLGYSAEGRIYSYSRGLLYGNLHAVNLNVIPLAIFIGMIFIQKQHYKKFANTKKLLFFILIFISMVTVSLSIRRSVLIVTLLAFSFFLFLNIFNINKKKSFTSIFFIIIFSLVLLGGTDVPNEFKNRFLSRGTINNQFVSLEEGRFFEYKLVFSDMFVKARYSLFTGYELFNSSGNYGDGYYGNRTLHSDLTQILHSSGLLGLILYLCIIYTAFRKSKNNLTDRYDFLIFIFCSIVFAIFTLTGRFYQAYYSILFYLLLLFPLTKFKIFRERSLKNEK